MNLSAIFTVLNVVTLNIWGLPPIPLSSLAPYRSERVDQFCAKLREQAADPKGWDVVLLQEAWVASDRKRLAGCGYAYVVDRDVPFALVDSGLMILSRYEIDPESVARKNFSTGGDISGIFADGEVLARKAALIAQVLHPKVGPIWVANTHLISVYDRAPDPDRYFSERQAQISEYLNWVRETVGRSPVIIGGDFNFGRGSSQWDWLLEKLPDFVQSPAADEYCTVQPEGSSDYLTRYDVSRQGAQACKYDHLLASPHFTGIQGGITLDQVYEFGDGDRMRVSDHLGWESQFEIRLPEFEITLPNYLFPFQPGYPLPEGTERLVERVHDS